MRALAESNPVNWAPPAKPAKVLLDAQIIELRREIALRKNYYARFVGEGRLAASTAEHRIAALESTVATLSALRSFDLERGR
ncbi:MAG TPA: hypothetical protein VGF92_15760 [Stellaceae bacterium]|jgi:hypothetical protein